MTEDQESILEQAYGDAETAYSAAYKRLLDARAMGSRLEYNLAIDNCIQADTRVKGAAKALAAFRSGMPTDQTT